MRVVKHGNMSYYRENEHTCASCGCQFAFTLADISYKVDFNDQDKPVSCNFVICPECKTLYILNQETDNGEPAGGGTSDPSTDPSSDPTNPTGGD